MLNWGTGTVMEDLTGRQLGPYQIIAPLGEGGMAAVYKAFQPGVERFVAMKILPRHLASDPQFVFRFQQEAKLLARLQHPHILPIHDFGEVDGYSYLVMPFIEGGTLVDLMKGEPLPLSTMRRIITQVGDALDYAHASGLIHRDVKPSNVLIDTRGNCLLTDFGIAKIIGNASLSTTNGATGTPAYMAPEQGLGRKIDGRSDQYALGVILYELATGRLPYNAETPMAVVIKHIYDPLPLPRSLNPALPPAVETIILKALAKDPEDRYDSVGDLVGALQAAIPDTGSLNPAILTTGRISPIKHAFNSAHYLRLALAGMTVLATALAFFLLATWNNVLGSAPATATSIPTSLPTQETIFTPVPASATPQPAPTATPPPASTSVPTLGLGSTEVSPVDGMVLLYVPSGSFLMGAPDTDENATAFERPLREVTIDAFWIDRTEVTNGQYALCVAAGVCHQPISLKSATRANYYSDPAYRDYPVIYVNWQEARTYCEWAGRRLPTEAEWEKAARGTDGRLFPWGDAQPSRTRANFARSRSDTTAVGSYPDSLSPYGAHDMAGNVWEWVSDWYLGAYYRQAPDVNPLGPSSGTARVLRGGAWISEIRDVRAAARYNYGPTKRENFIGFRCAR